MAFERHDDEHDNDSDAEVPTPSMKSALKPASLHAYAYSTAALDNDARDALVEDAPDEEETHGDDADKATSGVGRDADIDAHDGDSGPERHARSTSSQVPSSSEIPADDPVISPPHTHETHSATYNFTWDASGSTDPNDPWLGTKGDGTEEHNIETSYACDGNEYDDADYGDYYDEEHEYNDNDDADFY